MKIIVVPTDFSPVSVNAANFAVNMANAIKAEVLLVNIYQLPLAYSTEVPLMLMSVDDLKKSSESQLNGLKEKMALQTAGKINVGTRAIMGDTIDELERLCNEINPFAVIMGAKGQNGLDKMLFGSTTLRAIRHLTFPVIAVPPGRMYSKGIQRIGFACDFKQVAQTIPVRLLREIVWEFDAELHVLNIDHLEHHFKPGTAEESSRLHKLLRDLNPIYHHIESADVEDGVTRFAAENQLDLVITVPKKHKLLEGLFKAGSTKQLVLRSQVPVMCIHD